MLPGPTHPGGLGIGFVRSTVAPTLQKRISRLLAPIFCTACSVLAACTYCKYLPGPSACPVFLEHHVKRSRWSDMATPIGAGHGRIAPYYGYSKSQLPISGIDWDLGRLWVPSGLQFNLPGRSMESSWVDWERTKNVL